MTEKLTKKEYRENFTIRRAMIVHEDGLMLSRFGISATTQSFMLAAALVLFLDAYRNPRLIGLLLILISVLAFLVHDFFGKSIRAAARQQRRVIGIERSEDCRPHIGDVFPLAEDSTATIVLEQCLQSHGEVLTKGFVCERFFRHVMLVIWFAMVAMGICITFNISCPYLGSFILPKG